MSKDPGFVLEKTLGLETSLPEEGFVKILSIDGGGIRGIIPATILQFLESKLKKKKHLSECFHVMSGASTGGLITLLLNTPDSEGKPKYNTQTVIELYKNLGSEVFYRSFWHQLSSFNGWINEKYSQDNFKKKLQEYFDDVELKQSLTELLIPAYDLSQKKTIFFKSSKAKSENAKNFYFKDIACAATAAPTYFKPVSIQDLAGAATYTLIDGSVAIDSPSLSAAIHGLQIYNEQPNFLIVSIGTGINTNSDEEGASVSRREVKRGGKIAWASDIASLIMDAGDDVVDYLLKNAFVPNKIKKYYRFQANIDAKNADLDNTDKNNIKDLEKAALKLIEKNEETLCRIADILDG